MKNQVNKRNSDINIPLNSVDKRQTDTKLAKPNIEEGNLEASSPHSSAPKPNDKLKPQNERFDRYIQKRKVLETKA